MYIDLTVGMKTLIFFCAMLTGITAYAQHDDCERHFFTGGKKVSAAACYENNTAFGHARAYNRKGEVIYEKQIRKVAGHSYVQFDYYADGAVKRAEWHEAPDAGIQWYSSVTTFSEEGKVLSVTENNWDNRPGVTPGKPSTTTPPKPVKPIPKQVAECGPMMVSELWFINHAQYAVTVHAESMNKAYETATTTLEPGDTARCGVVVNMGQFANPATFFSVWVEVTRKNKHAGTAFLKTVTDGDNKQKQKYYYTIQ